MACIPQVLDPEYGHLGRSNSSGHCPFTDHQANTKDTKLTATLPLQNWF